MTTPSKKSRERRNETMLQMLAKGESNEKISSLLGVSVSTIWKFKKKISDETVCVAAKRIEKGTSYLYFIGDCDDDELKEEDFVGYNFVPVFYSYKLPFVRWHVIKKWLSCNTIYVRGMASLPDGCFKKDEFEEVLRNKFFEYNDLEYKIAGIPLPTEYQKNSVENTVEIEPI
jgi:hypothetical protein